MAELLKAATVKALAREFYGYDLTDESARALANTAGALVTNSRALEYLQLSGVEQPFSYANLLAEAQRLRQR